MKRYEKYKDSGIDWIGEIPEHWNCLKIKRLTNVKRGASPRPIDDPKYFDENGEFAWVRIADVTASERYLESTTQQLSELGSSFSVKRYPGDFFLSIAGTVGKPIITKIKCCIHDGFVWFPNLNTNPEYLYYIFSTGLPYQGLGKWGTQLNLNTDTVGEINIPLPKNEEIEGIISYLDEETAQMDKLITNKLKLIELLKEERMAIINNAVTRGMYPVVKLKPSGIDWLGDIPEHWHKKRLKYLIRRLESGVSVNSFDEPVMDGEIGILKTSCVYGFCFDPNENKKVIVSELERVKIQVRRNTIIISRMNTPELVGACGYVKEDYPNLFLPDRLWQTVFWNESELNVKWLYYLMICSFFRRIISSLATGTSSSMKNISQDDLLNIFIPFPEKNEQTDIVKYIEDETQRIDNTIAKVEKELDLFKEYRTALISEVVTGKVKVI